MITMFRKYWSRLKNKVCPALLLICLISCICSPFASADYSGTGTVRLTQVRNEGYNDTNVIVTNISKSQSLPFTDVIMVGQSDGHSTLKYAGYILDSVTVPNVIFTSTVSVYFSCFAQFAVGEHHFRKPWLFVSPVPTYTASYTDIDTGLTGTTDQLSYDTFVPVSNMDASNQGIILNAVYQGSSDMPLTDLAISGSGISFMWDNTTTWPNPASLQVVSFRVVTTDSSAELEGLEAIADQIVAQSEMMEAFYGDIVAVCNQIYNRLGDMQATAELANVYFQQMIALLQSIDSNTVNIYNLLSTQFELLLTAIETSTTDIESAIAAQTTALIAYFDTVFSGAVGTLPEKTDDLETNIGNLDDSESEYKSDASAKFEALSTEFTGFTGGTLSGIALASNLFTQVWNAMGEYSVVYSFPLLLGLCLLLIGRLSKHSGGQSSTDKERGDSDA